MSQRFEEPVVIVGGGIAGLALARRLKEEGISYRLVERKTISADGGLAFNLPGNAIQALSALGLREQIEAAGHPIRRRQYRTASDKLLFEIDEDAFWGEALRPRSVRRSVLLSMLMDGLPNDLIRYDTDVRSLVLHPTRPRVQLSGDFWNSTGLQASKPATLTRISRKPSALTAEIPVFAETDFDSAAR